MALLISFREISKQFGAEPLFRNISFNISDGERHGLIGPNGAGKSTLLAIASGREHPDTGEVVLRKRVRMAFVAQEPHFSPDLTVRMVVESEAHEDARIESVLGQTGFVDDTQKAGTLSGGWKKRLAIARALAAMPDLLLLDEPTNHLDVEGIVWLEQLLNSAPFGCLMVSHDRYFLENVATHVMELNRTYPDGLFRAPGSYSAFLEKRDDYYAAQQREREGLASTVRREVEWLKRGAKARTTKAKARVDNALEQIDTLRQMEDRARTSSVGIDFVATERRTKQLIVAKGVGKRFHGGNGLRDVSLVLTPGTRFGLAGPNGSGKTTLLRLLKGELPPDAGTVIRADNLRLVYFDQHRAQIDPTVTLRRALAPEGDSVIYRDRVTHVNGWAKRFLFQYEQLDQPVAKLSGGERARLAIARLMLEPADVLLMDEPTNDLDIPTLEVLEESLLEFPGAMLLVTHDRYLMDKVATTVLGIHEDGTTTQYADLAQWEADRAERTRANLPQPVRKELPKETVAASKKKFSYLEQREWDAMEEKILLAESDLEEKKAAIQTAAAADLQRAFEEMQAAQANVEALYARWAELEAKLTQ